MWLSEFNASHDDVVLLMRVCVCSITLALLGDQEDELEADATRHKRG